MVRVWISPEGVWEPYIARSNAAHLNLANEIAFSWGYIDKPPPFESPDYYKWALKQKRTPSQHLLANGWVRYSEGNVEGQPEAIRRNWTLIRDFVENDTIRYGMHVTVFFDIVDAEGRRTRSFQTSLEQVLKPFPPAGVFREPSIVQQFRRRPESVMVRSYRRRR